MAWVTHSCVQAVVQQLGLTAQTARMQGSPPQPAPRFLQLASQELPLLSQQAAFWAQTISGQGFLQIAPLSGALGALPLHTEWGQVGSPGFPLLLPLPLLAPLQSCGQNTSVSDGGSQTPLPQTGPGQSWGQSWVFSKGGSQTPFPQLGPPEVEELALDELLDALEDEEALDELLDASNEVLELLAPPTPLVPLLPPAPVAPPPKRVPESGKPQALRPRPSSVAPSAAARRRRWPRDPLPRRPLFAVSCAILMLLMPSSSPRLSYRREHGEMTAALRAWNGSRAGVLALIVGACASSREPSLSRPTAPLPAESSAASPAAPSVAVTTSPPPARPLPACPEALASPGAWPRASGQAGVVLGAPPALGHVEQALGGAPVTLRFFGAHLFDLLDKLDREGGPTERDRRLLACVALEAVARAGAPVVRLWGSLKRTGTAAEVLRSAELLALVVDENARRERPLRLVITLLNHQPGYGSPEPERSLDDQDPASPWSARRVYLEEGWRLPESGLLAARIEAFRAVPALVASPEILAWELVNELDTHRVLRTEAEARIFRERFVVPALTLLAQSFPQPLLLGDLRAPAERYDALARSVLGELPPALLARLIWTSHVYAPRAPRASAPEIGAATVKLDRDLALASERGLPFLLGELGQRAPGPDPGFCRDGQPHALGPLFEGVLDAPMGPPLRREITMALFWGEGHCALALSAEPGARRVTLGAGGDSADLGPGESEARARVMQERRRSRFRVE